MNVINNALYTTALETEREWMRAIAREFPGKRPGDVRYTAQGKGTPGSTLREAHDAHYVANKLWLDYLRDQVAA
jgi:hypothetical protein